MKSLSNPISWVRAIHFAPLVLFIGRRSGFESGKQQVGHFLMDHQNMNMSETYPNLGTCEEWRPFVWSWSRLSQLVDLQHTQTMGIAGTGEAWSPQRLCWTQLAADDAGAMKCQGLHVEKDGSAMARMTDVWTVLDLSEHLWKFRENPPNSLG